MLTTLNIKIWEINSKSIIVLTNTNWSLAVYKQSFHRPVSYLFLFAPISQSHVS